MKYRALYTFINLLSGIFILISSLSTSLYATGSQTEGYKVNRSSSTQIIVHGECREVQAPANYDIFVPTNNPTLEWNNSKIGIPRINGVISNCTRTAYCGGSVGNIPANSYAMYNSWPYGYTQTYGIPVWTPVYNWQYGASNACGYTCSNNYQWSGSSCIYCPAGNHIEYGSCVSDTREQSCGGGIPSNASNNSFKWTFTQNWYGYWNPYSMNWNYNIWGGECTFSCNSGYQWNGWSCEVIAPPATITYYSDCTVLTHPTPPNTPQTITISMGGTIGSVGNTFSIGGAQQQSDGSLYCPGPPPGAICSNYPAGYGCIESGTTPTTPPPATPPPTITHSRTPNGGPVGTVYNNVWSTAHATSLSWSCNGAFNGAGGAGLSGQQLNHIYGTDLIGTTYCTWTAVGPGGTTTIVDNFTVTPSVCVNDANNPPTCNQCNSGYTWNGFNCVQNQNYTYSWVTSLFNNCSVSCGGGTQSRSVECKRNDGQTVSDGMCSGAKPTTTQSCNAQNCTGGDCELFYAYASGGPVESAEVYPGTERFFGNEFAFTYIGSKLIVTPAPGGKNFSCPAAPSCSDGIQNQSEEGVDCGGTCANACAEPEVCICTPSVQDGNGINFDNPVDIALNDWFIFKQGWYADGYHEVNCIGNFRRTIIGTSTKKEVKIECGCAVVNGVIECF